MISYIEGNVLKRGQKHIVLLTFGVGYKIFMVPSNIDKLQQNTSKVKVYTHMHVKEDVFELFGFLNEDDLEFFEMLITVSGVGPKAALNIMSLDKASVIAGAVLREDLNYLTKVSGIGRKTAEKITLELKDKIAKLNFDIKGSEESEYDSEVFEALVAMGYSLKDVREALRDMSPGLKKVEDKIREVLKILGKNK